MQFDNTPEPDISMDEDWPALSSATIDCPASGEPTPIGRVSQEPPNERQRPTRIANRPTRYRDNSFETHFQPVSRRHCRKTQRQDTTGYNDINAKVRHELGRGVNHKNIASTGNENAEQKPPFRPETSHHPRSIASFHPCPSNNLLATSRSLNNNQRRYRREGKERMKFATLPYSPMNDKDKKNSMKTSLPHQKRSRTAHLQHSSIAHMRVSTDHRFAVSRGSETAEEVIIVPPPAALHRAQALMIDSRSIPTAAMHARLTAVSGSENAETISVSVDRTTLSSDNRPPEKPTHAEPCKFHPQRQDPQIKITDVQTSLNLTISADKCRVIDDAPTEKNKIAETTVSAATDDKKTHRHRFRRKKPQKDQ